MYIHCIIFFQVILRVIPSLFLMSHLYELGKTVGGIPS